MNRLKNIFISGLISFAPIAISIYVISSGLSLVENLLGTHIKSYLPEGAYIPGYGFIAVILLIFIIGVLVNNYITATFFKQLQKTLSEVPLIKTVYSPLRDLMNLFAQGKNQKTLQKVVLVSISEHLSVIGLVTREHFDDLELNIQISNDKMAVFIPMSYGLGGYTMLVNKSAVEPVDIPIEKAMSLAVTAWIKTDKDYTHHKGS